MKKLLDYILISMFDNEEIKTEEEEEEEGIVTLTIIAPQDIIGRIIGKNGKVINAIKQLIKIKAIKENKKVEIRVTEKDD